MSIEQLNEMIDQMYDEREEYYKAKKESDDKEQQYKATQAMCIAKAQELGLKTAGTFKAKISISEETVPNVTDWEAVFNFVKENDAFYLLRKQLNTGPFREHLAAGEAIPGVDSFNKVKLSLTKA